MISGDVPTELSEATRLSAFLGSTVTGTPVTSAGQTPLGADGKPLGSVTATDIAHAYAAPAPPAPPALPTTGTEAGTLALIGGGLLGLGALLLLAVRRRRA
ncbi:MAG: LPXTG cell wall anchor domain-containing protein [Dermatophilaceae bacterium]